MAHTLTNKICAHSLIKKITCIIFNKTAEMVQKITGSVESNTVAMQNVTKPCPEHRGANFTTVKPSE
jgi:hypothetical protein